MHNQEYKLYKYNTVIVGSGAAGLNAAVSLWKQGQRDIAIVTEGLKMGTSRNTGSDKQTYYKLTQCGKEEDSIWKMAKTLFDGGCMDGDIAMAEAAGSLRAFYHLVDIGVPFPFNHNGEYIGYKTDHDPLSRGTSAGPFTSKYMTNLLEEEAEDLGIPIFDGYQVIKLLTETDGDELVVSGLLALDKKACVSRLSSDSYVAFSVVNVIWATGGDAGMYESSVYPISQTGGMGVLFDAGAKAKNLTESQFGIASVQYRWNLSGTYQQCIPRYVSMNPDGSDEREFLNEYFEQPNKIITAIFLKGYQWPFDPRKLQDGGSSLIDLLVYQEQVIKGRKVFLDFMNNPSPLMQDGRVCFENLVGDAREYLKKSQALLETPFERLQYMNPESIKVYSVHNIDLSRELLEIAVCAQHNNGGMSGSVWWESNVKHLFPIGEVNGSHGVYRPGGSALNSGQVGAVRASQYIAANYAGNPKEESTFIERFGDKIQKEIEYANKHIENLDCLNVKAELHQMSRRMTSYGACIRTRDGILKALEENKVQRKRLEEDFGLESSRQLHELYKLKSLLLSQYMYLRAMLDYDERVGISRGSFLVYSPNGELPNPAVDERFRNITESTDTSVLQEITYNNENDDCIMTWRPVRPLAEEEIWFENIWKDFRENAIIK